MSVQQPQLRFEYAAPGSLKVREGSARHHPQKQIRKLRGSLRAFGCVVPLVVDDDLTIVCGAGRLRAAIDERLKTVPIVRVSHLDAGQLHALALADNRLAEEAVWSKALLKKEFEGLLELGVDLDLTGFDQVEIDTTLTIDLEPADAEDRVDLATGPVVSRLHDLWWIGDHRLAVGDARDQSVYDQLLKGEQAQFVFCDTPYGCRIRNNVSGLGKVKHDDFVLGATGKLDAGFSHGLLRPALKCLRQVSAPGCIAMICMDWRGLPFLLDAAQGVFEEVKNLICRGPRSGSPPSTAGRKPRSPRSGTAPSTTESRSPSGCSSGRDCGARSGSALSLRRTGRRPRKGSISSSWAPPARAAAGSRRASPPDRSRAASGATSCLTIWRGPPGRDYAGSCATLARMSAAGALDEG